MGAQLTRQRNKIWIPFGGIEMAWSVRAQFLTILFFALLVGGQPLASGRTLALDPNRPTTSRSMIRTELYFGAVPLSNWHQFLSEVVTPLFPEGLTWFDVQGQWLARDGQTHHLPSRILIILYPDTPENDRAIEKIRRRFIDQFHHQSVLRISANVRASF